MLPTDKLVLGVIRWAAAAAAAVVAATERNDAAALGC
jgi:hypothetical protein